MSYANSQFRTPSPARINQRQDKRHIVMLRPANLRKNTSKIFEGFVSEISIYGCRLYADTTFRMGDHISISLPDCDLMTAYVVWIEEGRLGCRFDKALDAELLRQMTLRIR
jgi:hypothetical protein